MSRFLLVAAALIALQGCSLRTDGERNGEPEASGAPSTASRVTALTSVDECPNGGARVETGIDDNENGLLDDEEVDEVVVVCNGADGQAGTPGTNGQDGAPGTDGTEGTNAITRVDEELPGAHCANGGAAVHAGVDDDGDGLLDDAEIDSTQYVCDGTDGQDGSQGLVGQDAQSSLVRIDAVAPGLACPEGGVAVSAGQDDDGDGVLDPAEVDSERFV